MIPRRLQIYWRDRLNFYVELALSFYGFINKKAQENSALMLHLNAQRFLICVI